MSAFDPDAWKQTDTGSDENEAPADGSYDVTIVEARAFTSKAGNDIMIIEVRAIDGSERGRSWTIMHGFKSTGAIKAAKTTCERLGIDPAVASLDELHERLQAVGGRYFTVNVKRNGDFVNTYVEEPLQDGSVSDVPADIEGLEPAAAGVGTDDDSIPFARPVIRDRSVRRRDLFAGDRWVA